MEICIHCYVHELPMSCTVCICRMMQLDYEGTSVLLLTNRNGSDSEDNEDDDDEYIIYSNL